MSDGDPPKSRPIRAVKQTSGLLPADRVKPAPSPELQSEAEKRREEREIAKEQREEAKEKREERAARGSRRVATFAVVVSLLGSGATATVAIMSMRATQASAQANIKSSAEQAQSAFLRDQKKSAYAEFYASAVEMARAENDVYEWCSTNWPWRVENAPDQRTYQRLESEFQSLEDIRSDRLRDLSAKYAYVYMVASPEVEKTAFTIRNLYAGGQLELLRKEASAAVLLSPISFGGKVLDTYRGVLSMSGSNAQQFLSAVRADYGQAPIG